MTYYIDRINGLPGGDGLTPETARQTYLDLPIIPGDTVLFRRGTLMRENLVFTPGEDGKPVTYGAYGEGENPIFNGAVDVSGEENWQEISPNVWRCVGNIPSEAGNIIFNGGESCGTLRWTAEELMEQGDWNDNRFGSAKAKREVPETVFLLYSCGNPGAVYSRIEVAVYGAHRLATCADFVICQDLTFECSGIHGIRGPASHMTIRRCKFRNIGGCVWSHELKIRLGNGIEFWNRSEHNLVEDCEFDNIYDSCTTHQGNTQCVPAVNQVIRGCKFRRYGMAAYEGRDHMSVDSAFENNDCELAGVGFAMQGDTVPRRSEIYPQPMGHHLFFWRMERAVEGGSFRVTGNRFGSAPVGAAMYFIIAPEAEAQMHFSDNRYEMEDSLLVARFGGRDYTPAEECPLK